MVSGVTSLTKTDWGKQGRFNLGNLTKAQSNIENAKYSSQNKFIAQAIAEAIRVVIQINATAGMTKQENPGAKMSGPILKQPTFNWKAEDKY